MSEVAMRPMDRINLALSSENVRAQFQNCLREKAGAFIASLIDLYGSDKYLQECDPQAVVMEAVKAATLDLPINKQLGFAYIVPYKKVPQFQMGYKGYIQLGLRSGQYRTLNANIVPEGIEVDEDLLTGEVTFSGERTSKKPQGYFAHMVLLNGFTKTLYMTKADVEDHAKRYSKSFAYDSSAWKTNFDQMAKKTVIRILLSHYGPMSTDMVTALTSSRDDEADEGDFDQEVQDKANGETIEGEWTEKTEGEATDAQEGQKAGAQAQQGNGSQAGQPDKRPPATSPNPPKAAKKPRDNPDF